MRAAIFLLNLALCFLVSAQGTFQNLDFEQAGMYLTPIPAGLTGGEVPIANGLPGWAGYFGTVQQTQVLQNNLTTGAASIDILGPNFNADIIDGSFSAVLQAGLVFGGSFVNATIAQSETIPASVQSLEFKASGGGVLSVSFAGNTLTLFPLSTGSGTSAQYTLYGANVAPYAGENGQLSISSTLGTAELDDIGFSSNAVPEPSPFVLSGIAGLLFAAYRRRGERKNLDGGKPIHQEGL
jgi:hypothetical protein